MSPSMPDSPPDDAPSTLVLVKPDAVRRGLTGRVITAIEEKGLRIEALRMLRVDRQLAERHYAEHTDKPFFDELVEFITSGPVVAVAVGGEAAIPAVRQLMGATDPLEAAPGSLRGRFGTDIEHNLVHGSDSPESARRELELFFPGR